MTTTELNKRACSLLDIHWHNVEIIDGSYVCKTCGVVANNCLTACSQYNPDFTTPSGRIELLEIMKEKDEEEYTVFIMRLVAKYFSPNQRSVGGLAVQGYCVLMLNTYLLGNPTALVEAVIKFLGEGKK